MARAYTVLARAGAGAYDREVSEPPRSLPFPESLCHECAAPPRYVRSAASTFILCPLLPEKYPRQPVRACALFVPKPPAPNSR
jgi:hypothetical protein